MAAVIIARKKKDTAVDSQPPVSRPVCMPAHTRPQKY